MTKSIDIGDILDKATCLYDQAAINQTLDKMANEINHHPLSKKKPVLLCVAVGGIIPVVGLSLRLNFPLEMDYIHVGSYGDGFEGGQLVWKKEPTLDLAGRIVVIVDDILDRGVTLAAIKHYCEEKGADQVYTVAFIDKQVERSPSGLVHADFTGLSIENRYVFGYGLDYKGYLRNVPGIYQVANEHLV